MTDTSERYRKLSTLFTQKVEGVADDAWSEPSPCEDWTARDVVRHVVESTGMFFGLVGAEPPAGPSVDDDPVGAWAATRDAMQAALDDPAIATREYDGHFGRKSFEESVGQFICGDLVVHNWDLSRATQQDERLDPDEVHRLYETMASMGDVMRTSGAFGPEVEAPEGADEQTQLLCFSGRHV